MIAPMRKIQPIIHQGQIAAVVVGGLAVIEDTLTDTAHRHVQAMCLYALEIEDRERPGPYNDTAADTYAQAALAQNPLVAHDR
jgi:hypothetical protein